MCSETRLLGHRRTFAARYNKMRPQFQPTPRVPGGKSGSQQGFGSTQFSLDTDLTPSSVQNHMKPRALVIRGFCSGNADLNFGGSAFGIGKAAFGDGVKMGTGRIPFYRRQKYENTIMNRDLDEEAATTLSESI